GGIFVATNRTAFPWRDPGRPGLGWSPGVPVGRLDRSPVPPSKRQVARQPQQERTEEEPSEGECLLHLGVLVRHPEPPPHLLRERVALLLVEERHGLDNHERHDPADPGDGEPFLTHRRAPPCPSRRP